jgi:hypothetical protein
VVETGIRRSLKGKGISSGRSEMCSERSRYCECIGKCIIKRYDEPLCVSMNVKNGTIKCVVIAKLFLVWFRYVFFSLFLSF